MARVVQLKRKRRAPRRPEQEDARGAQDGRGAEPLRQGRGAQVLPADAAAVQADGTPERQHQHHAPRELGLDENFHVENRWPSSSLAASEPIMRRYLQTGASRARRGRWSHPGLLHRPLDVPAEGGPEQVVQDLERAIRVPPSPESQRQRPCPLECVPREHGRAAWNSSKSVAGPRHRSRGLVRVLSPEVPKVRPLPEVANDALEAGPPPTACRPGILADLLRRLVHVRPREPQQREMGGAAAAPARTGCRRPASRPWTPPRREP